MEKSKKSNFRKKRRYNKEENKGDKIVYSIKPEGPAPAEDWQLKLMAIYDCFNLKGKENYKELVENRYNELKDKQK